VRKVRTEAKKLVQGEEERIIGEGTHTTDETLSKIAKKTLDLEEMAFNQSTKLL
jgi:pre-mRNA-splicing helicase BRR2